MPPPSSISTPSRSFGSWRLMSLAKRGRLLPRDIRGQVDAGVGDLARLGALGGDLPGALAGVRAGDLEIAQLGDAVEARRSWPRTVGSSTPCGARNTTEPPNPAPNPPKWSSRMSEPRLDSTSGRPNSSDSVPRALRVVKPTTRVTIRDHDHPTAPVAPAPQASEHRASTRCRTGARRGEGNYRPFDATWASLPAGGVIGHTIPRVAGQSTGAAGAERRQSGDRTHAALP